MLKMNLGQEASLSLPSLPSRRVALLLLLLQPLLWGQGLT